MRNLDSLSTMYLSFLFFGNKYILSVTLPAPAVIPLTVQAGSCWLGSRWNVVDSPGSVVAGASTVTRQNPVVGWSNAVL